VLFGSRRAIVGQAGPSAGIFQGNQGGQRQGFEQAVILPISRAVVSAIATLPRSIAR
jgi:hypothetical protein